MNPLKKTIEKYISALKLRDIKLLSKLFQEIVILRNKIATSEGADNYIDLHVNKIYRIPEADWEKYQKQKDQVGKKYFSAKETFSNSPHFLSKLPMVEISYPDGVIGLLAKKFPELNKVSNKIIIAVSYGGAYFNYDKKTDQYSIHIPGVGHNQKVSMLIHELAHVVSQEKTKHQEYTYEMELNAHKIEFEIAKSISPDFYESVIKEYLMCFVRSDFQISMFTHPNNNPVSVYTEVFEKYVGKLNPGNNTDFFYDKKLTHSPLVDLPSAVSITNLAIQAIP